MSAIVAQLRHFIALADDRFVYARGRQHARLTGRTVLERARQVLAQMDELNQVMQHQASGDDGQVRLGLGPNPAVMHVRLAIAGK